MAIANDSSNFEVRIRYLENLEISRTSRYEMNT
jgi:hypothetical protein